MNEKTKSPFIWPLSAAGNINLYARNVSGKITSYSNGEHTFPIFLNDHSTCWITSIYTTKSFYFKKALKNTPNIPFHLRILLNVLLIIQAILAKIVSLDNTTYFNHSISSTTLWPDQLTDPEKIIADMKQQYPDRAIVFRSLNFKHNEKIIHSLLKHNAKPLHFREIFCFDPNDALKKAPRNTLKKDFSLIQEMGYQIIEKGDLTLSDMPILYELYTKLYISKHSEKNPHYTVQFFETILKDDSYDIFALKKDNVLQAFALYEIKNNVMQIPCVGYDLNAERKSGLYRQLVALAFNLALSKKIQFNCSSGVAKFKLNRGAVQTAEYYLIYIEHLPWIKRIVWNWLIKLFNKSLPWALAIFAKSK